MYYNYVLYVILSILLFTFEKNAVMKQTYLLLLFVAVICNSSSIAQEKEQFSSFARTTDSLTQDDYKRRDTTAYRRHLNEFIKRYDLQSLEDKEEYKSMLDNFYYNFSCTYALMGNKPNALYCLEKSEYFDYDHLLKDTDLDTLRKEAQFIHFLEKAKRQSSLYSGRAFKSPYKPNLTDDEKIAGLSLLWSQAKYNFVYFDRLDIDWNKTYLDYIPKVKATKTTAEYYKVLETFYALLKDGHTNVYPPDELSKDFYSRPPMSTQLIEGRVFIIKVYSDSLRKTGIEPGLEILKMDGKPVLDYAAKNIAPHESSSTPQDMEIRTFSYALLCGPEKKPITLELRDRNNRVFTKSIARTGYRDIKYTGSGFEYQEIGNIGYLAINNMEDPKINKKFDALFDSISKTKGLVIDVRNNGGGSSSIGYNILRKLTDKPFKSSTAKWLKYISTTEGKTGWEVAAPYAINPDGKKYYSKPVVVLIGPRTFSAAEDFVVAFDYMKRGKLIGQPTGGSTGQPIFFDLPGGGSARICGKRDAYPDGKEFVGIGIMPDIIVAPTIKDLQNGVDAAKNKALEYLNNQ